MSDRRNEPRDVDEPLHWYSMFRIPLPQLMALATLLIALGGLWFRVEAHEQRIEEVKQLAQTKESANGDLRLILSKLDEMKDRLGRIETQLEVQQTRREQK